MRRSVATNYDNWGDGLMIHIGLESYIPEERIRMVLKLTSSVWHLIEAAKKEGKVINATYGRPIRSAIFMDDGRIVLSMLEPSAIMRRAG